MIKTVNTYAKANRYVVLPKRFQCFCRYYLYLKHKTLFDTVTASIDSCLLFTTRQERFQLYATIKKKEKNRQNQQ